MHPRLLFCSEAITCARTDMPAQDRFAQKPARNALSRAVRGLGGGPLSDAQKRNICLLARAAWERAGKPGFADQVGPAEVALSQTEAFTLWRHRQTFRAVGRESLKACTQREYPAVMAHFAQDAGMSGEARYWLGRMVGDETRQARGVLNRAILQASDVIGNPRGYVASIAASRFRTTDLESLSGRQVMTLVFDLRRNAQRRRADRGEVACIP